MNETLKKRIQKLLNLANGTSFKEEAASAFAKAQALMEEHRITSAMLDQLEDEEIQLFAHPINEEDIERRAHVARWKSHLIATLAKANGVFCMAGRNRIIASGKLSNVNSLRYIYGYCLRKIEELAAKNGKVGKAYQNAFKLGCAVAIQQAVALEHAAMLQRLREEAARNNNERGLIVLDNALVKIQKEAIDAENYAHNNLNIRENTNQTTRHSNWEAFRAGVAAGSTIYNSGKRESLGGAQEKLE